MVPIDSIAAQDWADKAKAANIPIVALAVFVGDARKHQPPWIYPALLAYADRNNVDQAYAVGKLAVADHPNGGKVAIVEGFPGFAAVELRAMGFDKALKESKAHFEVVAKQAGNWDPERAHQICQDAIQAHPDISIIFSHDQAMARGCLSALKSAKSNAKIYAIDSSKDVEALIRRRADRNHVRQSGDERPAGHDGARQIPPHEAGTRRPFHNLQVGYGQEEQRGHLSSGILRGHAA